MEIDPLPLVVVLVLEFGHGPGGQGWELIPNTQ
jgi:hypothetical protein